MTSTKIINVIKDDSFDEIFDLFKTTAAEEVIFILPKKSKALANESHFQQIQAEADHQGKRVSLLSSNPTIVSLAHQFKFEVLQDKARAPKKARTKKAEPVPVLAAATDPSDDEPIPDDSDAFDPLSPSDETTEVIDDEKEEEGRAVDTEEVLEDDAQVADINLPTSESLEDAEIDEPEEIEKAADENIDPAEAEIDESAYQDFAEEELVDPELSRAPQRRPVASIAAHGQKTDRIVHTADGRRLRVHGSGHTVPLGMRKDKVYKRNLDQIAEVWQQEPFEHGGTVWSDLRPRSKSSLLSRFFSRDKVQRVERPILRPAVAPQRKSRRALKMAALVLILAGGGFVYTTTGKAQIIIMPFAKKLDFDLSINVSDQFSTIDATFNKLPGQLFVVDKSVIQEFHSTGQREVAQKARGKITVYNTYGTTPQTLIATTRFESSNGLILRTLLTVTVPGTTVENGVVRPGSVQVDVIADKAGENYNVPAGRFTIPAFKEKNDTDRYTKFYGQSTEAMKEGKSGVAKVVTEADFAKGKEIVQEKLRGEILEALRDEASGLKIADTASISITRSESSVAVDLAADTFVITIDGRLKTMGFKEEDLWKLLRQHVEKNYGLTLVPEKMELTYKEARFNESRGILELSIHLSGNGYGTINTGQIITDLLGKGEGDIVGYLKEASGVAEARVLLSPFWVKKVPKNKEKVNILLDYQ